MLKQRDNRIIFPAETNKSYRRLHGRQRHARNTRVCKLFETSERARHKTTLGAVVDQEYKQLRDLSVTDTTPSQPPLAWAGAAPLARPERNNAVYVVSRTTHHHTHRFAAVRFYSKVCTLCDTAVSLADECPT